MFDTYKMQEHICKELEKKSESGIKSTQDLDTVWKLTGTLKDLMKIDMLEEAEEYTDGHSERRKRDRLGRYSRDYDRGSSYAEAKDGYMDAKHSYRSTRSTDSKRDMNKRLDECMDSLMDEIKELIANADTREEREKLQDMMREIGNMT